MEKRNNLEEPVVSIIIAAFNSANTIRMALDSVLNQSYQKWECIIVDGGSSDGTISILELYSNIDSRFKYKSEPDKGIYDAFNKGWQRASCEWILYLGSDDLMMPDGLKLVMESESPADCIYADHISTNCKGRRVHYNKHNNISSFKGIMISHQAMLMRRQLIKRLGGFNTSFRVCGDFELVQRAVKAGATFEYHPGYLTIFQSGGTCRKLFVIRLKEEYKIKLEYSGKSVILCRFNYFFRFIKESYYFVKTPIANFLLDIFNHFQPSKAITVLMLMKNETKI